MKPWQYWMAFIVCLTIVFAAMAWVSATVLRLDAWQGNARRQAAFEETVRLALWRMETALTPLIARESARPYFVYAPFYPAERAYNKMFEAIAAEEIMVPSPLLAEATPQIRLHFQVAPDGTWTSPRAPSGRGRELAEAVYGNSALMTADTTQLAAIEGRVTRDALLESIPTLGERGVQEAWSMALARLNTRSDQASAGPEPPWRVQQQQELMNTIEWNNRDVQQQRAQYRANPRLSPPSAPGQTGEPADTVHAVVEGPMKAFWLGDALMLARRVMVKGDEYVQGCWLDWPAIRRELLAEIQDLLNETALEPASGGQEPGGRLLAALPVRLRPGPMPELPARAGMTPIRLSLFIAWSCVLVAAAAAGILLSGAVALSERRGAFVSAVTHELRTPLTTFRMYSEMLAEDMVRDEEKRLRYLRTLCTEGARLSHLVENVLSFARLERGRVGGRAERVLLGTVLDRAADRLAQRATEADMTLIVEEEDDVARVAHVEVDVSAVEQILFNLVDNASKYASGAEDRRIHLRPVCEGDVAGFDVRDHGPGIAKRERRRLFQPFRKSAQHAAESAPGVGLGLALSRRLARNMGGRLSVNTTVTGGACFELRVPRLP